MSKRFDELFGEIVAILRRDYAGMSLVGDRFDPRYYNTAIGQAWHDNKLTELLFLRYVNQMLACTGDRRLHLALRPSDAYQPWDPGFFTRRYGNSLYITAVRGESGVTVGDRIVSVNGGSPAEHRAAIQKNFFYADEPEREDWRGLLKMADFIDVEHADGTREQLPVRRHPLHGMSPCPAQHVFPEGVILDLRNVPDISEEMLYSLLPLLCREDTPTAELIDPDIFVNYTRFNCLVKAAGLQDIPGTEDFIADLRDKAGKGFLRENIDDGVVIPGRASGRAVVLTDTWTRDGAETLALAAKRAGALLLGRPTLGTIDLCGDVSYELDERYILTWPTAVTGAARRGEGILGRGVAPDVYIPWTPEECERDLLMEAAVKQLKKKF